MAHGATDRGGPDRHDPPRPTWREDLDPGLPGQAGHPEAGGDPDGLGQGQPRTLGRRRASRPRALRRRPDPRAGRDGARDPEASDEGSIRGPPRDPRCPGGPGLMPGSEFAAMERSELEDRLAEARRELFNLRFQRATGQLDNTARLGQVRREVARALTFLRQRDLGIEEEPLMGGAPAATASPEERPRRRTRRGRTATPEEEADAAITEVVAADADEDEDMEEEA